MERSCGDCRFFRVTEQRPDGRIGECRLSKIIGVFRDTMHGCAAFARPGETPRLEGPTRRRTPTRPPTNRAPASFQVSAELVSGALRGLDSETCKEALLDGLAAAHGGPEGDLGRTWDAGMLLLVPADEQLKPKDLPIEQFLHKIVMIRDNLRVLEQKVNGHHQLSDGERLDLHRRLTQAQVALIRFSSGWLDVLDPDAGGPDALFDRLIDEALVGTRTLVEPPLGDRWVGGMARFSNGEITIEEPIERFYRRLLLVRDRLASLETRLARHAHIGEADGDAMAGYIRRGYGSLTSFNVLFRERDDYFASGR